MKLPFDLDHAEWQINIFSYFIYHFQVYLVKVKFNLLKNEIQFGH